MSGADFADGPVTLMTVRVLTVSAGCVLAFRRRSGAMDTGADFANGPVLWLG